jgi:hypothetical protein
MHPTEVQVMNMFMLSLHCIALAVLHELFPPLHVNFASARFSGSYDARIATALHVYVHVVIPSHELFPPLRTVDRHAVQCIHGNRTALHGGTACVLVQLTVHVRNFSHMKDELHGKG